MDVDFIYVASIIVAILFLSIAVFQVLLSLGYPLGESAMGGYYKVLPKKLRIASVANAGSIMYGLCFSAKYECLSWFGFFIYTYISMGYYHFPRLKYDRKSTISQ